MSAHVPTPAELVPLGEAIPIAGGAFRVLPAGHDRMGEAMRRRALEPLDYRAAVVAARERATDAKAK